MALPLARRGLLKGTGALALLSAAGFGRAQAGAADTTLSLRTDTDFAVLDPAYEKGAIEEELLRCLFVTLNRLADFREPIGWTPYAAESLEQLDPLRIRFTLHPGLSWSDGYGRMSAEDVQYSLERVAAAAESPYAYLYTALDHVEPLDALTGIIHLKAPRTAFLLTALPWYSGHILCKASMAKIGDRFTVAPPATCGPYRIADWRPNQSITLAANPDWIGPRPDIQRLRFSIIGDDEAAALAYEADAVDYSLISVNTLSLYQKAPPANSTLIAAPGTRIIFLALNIEHPLLADPRLRKAIQLAVNVDDILIGAFAGIGRRATGPIPDGMTGHRSRNLIENPDPAAARRLLAEAGATDLRLTLLTLSDTTYMTIALIIQANLREIGIAIEIKSLDSGTYWALGGSDTEEGGRKLQLALMDYPGSTDPSDNLGYFRTEAIGSDNWPRFSSAEFDRLYEECLSEADAAIRGGKYRRMQDLMEESGGFLFFTSGLFAAISRADFAPFILPDGHLDVPRSRRR